MSSRMHGHASRLPLRAGVVLAGGIGLLVVIAVALAARVWLSLGVAYPARVGAVFAGMVAVVWTFVGTHPHPRFGPANQVTLSRAALVALLAGLIGEPADADVAAAAAGAAVVVALLDGVDGWLARRTRMDGVFGARFDMETDALFVMVLSVLVWQWGKAGAWVFIGGLLRYAFVAAGWLLPWMAGPLTPTMRAKVVTVCHMTGLIVALAPFVPVRLSAIAVGGTLLLLCWSFAVDVRRLWRAAYGVPG